MMKWQSRKDRGIEFTIRSREKRRCKSTMRHRLTWRSSRIAFLLYFSSVCIVGHRAVDLSFALLIYFTIGMLLSKEAAIASLVQQVADALVRVKARVEMAIKLATASSSISLY
jgi:hypothetical protein